MQSKGGLKKKFRLAFTTTLSFEVLSRLRQEVERRGCYANVVVEEALREYLGLPPDDRERSNGGHGGKGVKRVVAERLAELLGEAHAGAGSGGDSSA